MPFSKHETFHTRERWLFKGMDAIKHYSTIFLSSDASERLALDKDFGAGLAFPDSGHRIDLGV